MNVPGVICDESIKSNPSMKSQNIGLKDLPPGFISAGKGGVVRIAELQSQGYLYLRP